MRTNEIGPDKYRPLTDKWRHVIKICATCRDAGHHKTYGKHWNIHWANRHPHEIKNGWVVIELPDGSSSEISLQLYNNHKKGKSNFQSNRIVSNL